MGNHFRKPEGEADVALTPERETASHFAYTAPAEESVAPVFTDIPQPAEPLGDPLGEPVVQPLETIGAAQAPVEAQAPAPVADPFAYQPANDEFSPQTPAPADAIAPKAPSVAPAAAPLEGVANLGMQIPDPAMPAAPVVEPDQALEVASLNTALQSGDFTSVFAPVEQSRKQMAREAGVDPVIVMEHVTKVYPAQPNKPALEDVNIEIYPGEFVFLVGHSGSGKSTLLRTIMREVKPSSGRVMVAGQDLTRIRNRKVPFLRRQMGIVFQDFRLLPNKTAYENVAFALECIGKPRGVIRVQVPEVLRLVGLADRMDATPDQLSGGEQQRVNVARAMVNRPPLLVCDEPTGNLDPAISLGIMKLLERINRTGTTVIVATHDREMVDSMHRRVIALEGGHVVRDQERGGYGNYGTL